MAGKGEAGLIDHGLGQRPGDEPARLPGLHQIHRAIEALHHGGRAGGVRRPRRRRGARAGGMDGKAGAEEALRFGHGAGAHRDIQPRRAARSRSRSGSPMTQKGGSSRSCRSRQARRVVSGPMPAGSPSVRTSGAVIGDRRLGRSCGSPPSASSIPPGTGWRQLVADLALLRAFTLHRRLFAHRENLDPGLGDFGRRQPAHIGLVENGAQLRRHIRRQAIDRRADHHFLQSLGRRKPASQPLKRALRAWLPPAGRHGPRNCAAPQR